MTHASGDAVRRIEPLAIDWCHDEWSGGCFDTARREYTDVVEGTIRVPQHVVLATLSGGADSLTVRASCGHRFHGAEHAGVISIVPAHCERELRMLGVEARWASLAIDSDAFERSGATAQLTHCVSNVRDGFLFSVLAELTRVRLEDGEIETLYSEAMTHAVAHYLARRYGGEREHRQIYRLTRWQMSRVDAYVEAHLAEPLRIADLAELVQCSLTHFHRAFRQTRQMTPLHYINHRRIQHAKHLLRNVPSANIADVAAACGYTSVNYFTRLFQRLVGTTPGRYRQCC